MKQRTKSAARIDRTRIDLGNLRNREQAVQRCRKQPENMPAREHGRRVRRAIAEQRNRNRPTCGMRIARRRPYVTTQDALDIGDSTPRGTDRHASGENQDASGAGEQRQQGDGSGSLGRRAGKFGKVGDTTSGGNIDPASSSISQGERGGIPSSARTREQNSDQRRRVRN